MSPQRHFYICLLAILKETCRSYRYNVHCVFCLSGENIIVWLIFSSGRCWSVGFSLGFHGSDERKQSLPGQGALNCLHQQKRHTSDFTPRRIRAARAKCSADLGDQVIGAEQRDWIQEMHLQPITLVYCSFWLSLITPLCGLPVAAGHEWTIMIASEESSCTFQAAL